MKLKVFSQLDKNQVFNGLETAVNTFQEQNPDIKIASIDTHKDGVMLVAVIKYEGELVAAEKAPQKFAPALPVVEPPAPVVNPDTFIGNVDNG